MNDETQAEKTCQTPGCNNPTGFWPDLCRACDIKALDETTQDV